MTEIHNAKILVVGTSGGLGSAISRDLAARGARLALSGRSAVRLGAIGVESAVFVIADLRDPGAAEQIVAQAEEQLGGLNVVVYVAGVVAFGAI